ncbi:MAG: prephenate dehydratase [Clostridiales bacterium]|nr:prephenate dehydratase [Clostridiales bacterium]
MKDLIRLREEIDAIDTQIVELYQKRMELSVGVAEYKIKTGKKVFDKEREEEKLEKLSKLAVSEFNRQGIRELFEQIMAMSRKRQYQLLTKKGLDGMPDFTEVSEPEHQNVRIVFQGTAGAYAQLALKEYFGEDADNHQVDTWRDAMEAIANGTADYAVLPIENSSAGIVSENYDLMVEYDCYIIGEQILRIDHALLGLPDAELSDITDVYSHPQALMQCGRYLEAHRAWERHSLKNTAVAAQMIKEEGKKQKAAIASTLTADIYGLKVIKPCIQDNQTNETRFIIVTGKRIFRKDASKISICFESPHKSGSLYHMLSHFIYNGLNMNHIESRPIQGKNWEYRFFVDFEGNLKDSAVQNALRGLKEETSLLKILGNY